MTPYQYVHNNPIMFTDPTGMEADWVPGENGDKITYSEDEKGNVAFQNLQDELKPLFEELVKTPTGKEELLNLLDDKDMKVSICVSDEKKMNYDHNYKKDMKVNGTFYALEFNEEKTAITVAEIYIYKGWRMEELKSEGYYNKSFIQTAKLFDFKDFTLNQLLAGDLVHEIRHRDPNNHKSLAPDLTNIEFNPNLIQRRTYEEMLINKSQNENKKKKR